MRVVVWLAVCMAVTGTLAHAEDDMAAMISQYRREHGLSAVKTDPQLTAIAERQAQARGERIATATDLWKKVQPLWPIVS